MAPRTIANKAYDYARRRCFEDLVETYPDLYRFFTEKRVQEYSDPTHEVYISRRGLPGEIRDKARRTALVDLREAREGAWQCLLPAWSAYYKEEFGWVDERAAANAGRDYAVRRADGRFAAKA